MLLVLIRLEAYICIQRLIMVIYTDHEEILGSEAINIHLNIQKRRK